MDVRMVLKWSIRFWGILGGKGEPGPGISGSNANCSDRRGARDSEVVTVWTEAAKIQGPQAQTTFILKELGAMAELRDVFAMALHLDDQTSDSVKNPGDDAQPKAKKDYSDPKPDDIIGDYKIKSLIDAGGMGNVYEAEQISVGNRLVALKVIKQGENIEDLAERLKKEIRTLAKMDHPNIARVYDAGELLGGYPYFVMEYVKGVRLDRFCEEKKPSIKERLELFSQVCQGIHHAHVNQVIHRDIKPSNILVTYEKGVPTPKIIDFGIAKVLQEAESAQDTSNQLTYNAGTYNYMSPEQILRDPSINAKSDIYSLGVLLYELLVGDVPFDSRKLAPLLFLLGAVFLPPKPPSEFLAQEPKSELEKRAAQRKTKPKKLIGALKEDLDWITLKALEKDRNKRYGSASDFVVDINNHFNSRPVGPAPDSVVYHGKKFVMAHPFGVAISSLILLLLLTLLAAQHFSQQRDVAEQLRAINEEVNAATISSRSGKWQEALDHIDKAEQRLGNQRDVNIGLMKAEALTILNQPDKSETVLKNLAKTNNMSVNELRANYGKILLRLADHEMFDSSTNNKAVAHIRDAKLAGLQPADSYLADGLLTNSAEVALASFRKATEIDPYCHAAQVHSLGLEFILGHHEALIADIQLLRVLYPQDPSWRHILAIECAFAGNTNAALEALEPLTNSMSSNAWKKLASGFHEAAEATRYLDVDTLIQKGGIDIHAISAHMGKAGALLKSAFADTNGSRLREPHLPCVEQGPLQGAAAVQGIANLSNRDVTPFVEQLNQSLRLCPDAFLAFEAGAYLEMRQPKNEVSLALREVRARLYQTAADTSSYLPGVPRLARFAATKDELELIRRHSTCEGEFRQNCSNNLAKACSFKPSLVECRAYLPIALELSEFDSARKFAQRWQEMAPNEEELAKNKVKLEFLLGNLAEVIKKLDESDRRFPGNSWTKEYRQDAISELQTLLSASQSAKNHLN